MNPNGKKCGSKITTHQSPSSVTGEESGTEDSSTKEVDSTTDDSSKIECDGTVYRRARDAPGQNCLYIAPGSHEVEIYRLATYSRFPADAPVMTVDLATVGFYYTGYNDRVKCFSCGLAVENWMLGDDEYDPRWHKEDCQMITGTDGRNEPMQASNYRNVLRSILGKSSTFTASNAIEYGTASAPPAPMICEERNSNLTVSTHSGRPVDVGDVTSNLRQIQISETFPEIKFANILSFQHENFLRGLNLRKESERRKTYDKWPAYPAPFLPKDLAKDGFFYLGNLDRAQCFSCNGVLRNWAPNDNIREQHFKHFPNCRIVKELNSGNLPMTEIERINANNEEQIRLQAILPNENLVEPEDPSPEEQHHLAQYYKCEEPINPHMRRFEARLETFDHRWPNNRIRATPEQIAKAGFFFLGESDKTKCFYCNGGLQNWDPNDEPWTEHAKWFPGCEFVLRNKGTAMVRRLVEAHPNLNRPSIRNAVSYNIPPFEASRLARLTVEGQMSSLDISRVKAMGFAESQIRNAISKKLDTGGFTNTEGLLDFLLDEGSAETNSLHTNEIAGGVREGAVAVVGVPGNKRNSGSSLPTEPKRTKMNDDENGIEDFSSIEEFNDSRLCRSCRTRPSDNVLIPCGHLSACSDCAPRLKHCVLCQRKVESALKEEESDEKISRVSPSRSKAYKHRISFL